MAQVLYKGPYGQALRLPMNESHHLEYNQHPVKRSSRERYFRKPKPCPSLFAPQMCEYKEVIMTHPECERAPKHITKRRYYERCANYPRAGTHCDEPVLNQNLAKMKDTKQSDGCWHCTKPGGAVAATEVIEEVRFLWPLAQHTKLWLI